MRALQARDIENLEQLKRVKLMATGVLVMCFIMLICAKLLEARYPGMAIVTAFAEAATIGGIADWYAVVVLFKKPLGLPIPHTAIVPANKDRIADNLGIFIETSFLQRNQVEEKLRGMDFAMEISEWLASRDRSERLAGFVLRLLPQLLESVDQKGLVRFVSEKATAQLSKTDLAPLVASLMENFTRDGRHQRLLNEIIKALHRFMSDAETLEIIRNKVQKELPTLLYLFQADNVILRRLVTATTDLLDEIRTQKDHPLRAEFEEFLEDFVIRTRRSKRFAKQVESLKTELLARPELAETAQDLWDALRDYILDDIDADDSVLHEGLTDLLVDIGADLQEEPQLSNDINATLVTVISNLVDAQKGSIADYIAQEVRGWDTDQLVQQIEANVGRDLQFIRFNGMLIGGAVGVCLHLILVLVLP